MAWRKYFKAPNTSGALSPVNGGSVAAQQNFRFQNYGSLLPEVYMGHPNRIERYNQYENMDCDSEVNACLDIIAEFSTQLNRDNKTPFDINFVDKPTDHEVEIIKSLGQNYGVVGHLYADYLAKHVSELATFVPEVVANTYKDFSATNDERFWMATVGCVVAACILFNRAGIAAIPVHEIIEAFKRQIINLRACIKGGKRSAEDVLNAYIQEYQGKFVVVKYGEKASPAAMFSDGTTIGKQTTRAEVMGRVEHGVTEGGVDFYIEERLMRMFCSNMSFSYTNFKSDIAQQFTVTFISKKDMMSKTEGPPMRVAAMCRTRNSIQFGSCSAMTSSRRRPSS